MTTFKQYTKKDGSKAWEFQAYLGINPMTGKPVKTTRRGFQTKKLGQLELNRLLVEFEKNGLQETKNETFEEIYNLWFETYITTVKEVTSIKTKIKFDKWILPKYGNLIINQVTVKYAQKIVNDWAKTTDQYRVLHSSAKRIFDYACNLGVIDTNPLSKVIMPKREKKIKEDIKVYSKDELTKLFNYINGQGGSYRKEYDKTIYRTMLYSGARVSELLALDWSDIDFNSNTISITKTLSQSEHGYKVSTPKNTSSIGTVVMDQQSMNVLKSWQINQRKYMLTLGITNPSSVFCGIYKEVITHHSIYIRLKTICEKSHVPFLGSHAFRHTCASMLLESGASMKDVQDRLRHSSITVSMDTYSHLTKETKENTVEKLVKHLNF